MPVSPANTATVAPVVALLPVDVDRPLLASLVNPADNTVAVSPTRAFTHCLARVRLAWMRLLTNSQVTPVSAGMVRLPLVPPPPTTTAPPLSLRTQLSAVV
ncbi:hypothetical protein D9M72_542820 [compost metagenome]